MKGRLTMTVYTLRIYTRARARTRRKGFRPALSPLVLSKGPVLPNLGQGQGISPTVQHRATSCPSGIMPPCTVCMGGMVPAGEERLWFR